MNDPRVEAARIRARLWMVSAMHASREQVIRDEVFCAYEVIQAADAADREQGIHRVRVDDATVERVYAEISHNLTPVIGRNRLRDRDGEQPEPLRPHIETAARAVLAALTGAES